MKTYAGEIAAKLQGAHRARTRGQDMGKAMNSVWDDNEATKAAQALVDEVDERLAKLIDLISGHAPDAPQASAVSAERVVELERQRDELQGRLAAEHEAAAELERQLAEARDEIGRLGATAQGALYEQGRAEDDAAGIRELLATAYVAREVPWTDVAAGMMTIARDGTPWMVESRGGNWVDLTNGSDHFRKEPAEGSARVLVPYVTPEAAEELVRSELGGRA